MNPSDVLAVMSAITDEHPPKYETLKIAESTKRPGVTCAICPTNPEWTERRMAFVIQQAARLKRLYEEVV